MNGEIIRLIHKEWGHPNITIAKAVKFGTGYLLAYPLSLGLLWILTEKVGFWYVYSSVIAGCFAAGLRFLISAVFAFEKKKEPKCKGD